ncbi:glycerophosphodiester phosphodiesterase family protein [Spirosoma foliorum]|uniref:Glycerophosphodiester phosphodiesterase n=1 Tax=Spirosoma foliorum TaxID=2710596 RepID=A0A7G5H0A0_9BACT|nr:glycerophosphodiester phosphodiesterase family protein [Spirosoma foliorum]QMW04542.1 glycerophosphodiester phosphodiesterase [Spirosoma foliorum]
MKIKLLLSLLLFNHVLLAQSKFDRQGHRGARGLMPENTIPAMKKAMDLGVQTLEMDAVISADKQVVVSHDTYMSADFVLKPDGTPVTADEQKNVNLYKLTYAEIKTFDVGSKPHPQFAQQQKFKAYKPLLSELIDSVETYAKAKGVPLPMYNIEIKSAPAGDGIAHPEPKEFVDLVLAVCQKKQLGKRLTIQSFDVRPLQLIHQQFPDVALSYLTANAKTLDENLAILGFKPRTYSPYYKTVTPDMVKTCHQQGMLIIPWTVNTKAEIESLQQVGVDGIISDYPNLFK